LMNVIKERTDRGVLTCEFLTTRHASLSPASLLKTGNPRD
jgi:hypothetical protein